MYHVYFRGWVDTGGVQINNLFVDATERNLVDALAMVATLLHGHLTAQPEILEANPTRVLSGEMEVCSWDA